MNRDLATLDADDLHAVVGAGPGFDAWMADCDWAVDTGGHYGGAAGATALGIATQYWAIPHGLAVGGYHMVKGVFTSDRETAPDSRAGYNPPSSDRRRQRR